MSLRWSRKRNPYRSGPFSILQFGPGATRRQLTANRKNLLRRIETDNAPVVEGEPLTENQVSNAIAVLSDPAGRAESLLYVHPYRPPENRESTLEQNSLLASLSPPTPREYLELTHPAAVCWFVAPPGRELLPVPTFDELKLVEAGSKEDLALDIVFDD